MGEKGSGLVPGLNEYGVSKRLAAKIREERCDNYSVEQYTLKHKHTEMAKSVNTLLNLLFWTKFYRPGGVGRNQK